MIIIMQKPVHLCQPVKFNSLDDYYNAKTCASLSACVVFLVPSSTDPVNGGVLSTIMAPEDTEAANPAPFIALTKMTEACTTFNYKIQYSSTVFNVQVHNKIIYSLNKNDRSLYNI